jgi:hypothetical protein
MKKIIIVLLFAVFMSGCPEHKKPEPPCRPFAKQGNPNLPVCDKD